jgi:phage baseplate assembly protein V
MWRQLYTRIVNLFARGTVKSAKSDKKLQLLQLDLLADETLDDVEHFEPFGLTAVPEEGAEVLVVSIGGKRDHAIALVATDRRYRPRNLQSGEVCLYGKNGQTIVMKANGDIEVTPKSGQKVIVNSDVQVTGDLACDKTVTAATDVVQGSGLTSISLKDHHHTYDDADTASGGSGGTNLSTSGAKH